MSKEDFKQSENLSANNKGIKAVLDHALQSYERLPMLEVVFERFVRSLTTALRNLTSESINIDIVGFKSLRFSNYLKSLKNHSAISIFKAIEWENLGLVVMDADLVSVCVDVLLGGKKASSFLKDKISSLGDEKDIKEKSMTYIEQALIKQVIDVILVELSSAFSPIGASTFVFDRLENNPAFATIARAGDAVILLQLETSLIGRGGILEILIPYSTIEPIKPLLQQVFIGDRFGTDVAWTEAMANTIYSIDLPVEVIISSKDSTIFDVTQLRVGHTIIMDHEHDEDVVVACGDVPLLKGQLGKVKNKVAVNVNNIMTKEW